MKNLAFLGIMFLLSACVSNPSYRQVGNNETELKAMDVNYKLSTEFHHDPPDCVVVMDSKADEHPEWGKEVAVAFARHLGAKVDRVIFPRKRLMIERKNAYDLSTQKGRHRFAVRTGCRYFGRSQLYDIGDQYVGFAAEKHIGIRLEISRVSDDEPLWQAAHTVWRASGSAPLSPISAVGGIASATAFKADEEVLPSLIDDAMRRMLRTLPYGVSELTPAVVASTQSRVQPVSPVQSKP